MTYVMTTEVVLNMTAAHIIQRPLRGSRISTFYPIKSLPSLSSLDSAFQLQEYISLLIRLDVHDVDSIVSLPGTSKKDCEKGNAEGAKEGDKDSDKKGEIQVDQACWIYEQLRYETEKKIKLVSCSLLAEYT